MEIRCRYYMGYSFSISSKVFFIYTSSHKHNSTYHGPCYISRGALAGTRNGCTMSDGSDDHHSVSRRSYISFTVMVQERKEVFYLTTHSTHLVTVIWRRTYGKDHSHSERENPLPPHGLLFPISSKGSFICTIPQTG